MSYQPKDNSGSLFKNENKTNDRGPDYSGTCMIDGTEYFMDSWLKTAETGRKWMSFAFKPKQKQPQQAAKPSQPAKNLRDMDSDIPF